MYSSDKYFFQFIFHGNKKQTISGLKYINTSQFKFLKKIGSDILDRHIPLSSNQIKLLKKSASFIRSLARKRTIHNKNLIKYYNIGKLSKFILILNIQLVLKDLRDFMNL